MGLGFGLHCDDSTPTMNRLRRTPALAILIFGVAAAAFVWAWPYGERLARWIFK